MHLRQNSTKRPWKKQGLGSNPLMHLTYPKAAPRMPAQVDLVDSMSTSKAISWRNSKINPLTSSRTETKATTVYSVRELLSVLPRNLHSGVRSSKYYIASNDSLTFQDQTHRSRSANADENRRKLVEEVTRIYQIATPAETSKEKKKKYEAM